MDPRGLAAQFERDGFLVIDRFFDAAIMDVMDRVIRAHFGNDPEFLHTDEFLESPTTDENVEKRTAD